MITIFLANGFEMIEALTPCDILKRAGADVKLVSITDSLTVTSTHGVTVTCDVTLSELSPNEIDMLILPGGLPGADNLYHCETLRELILAADKNEKPIAAICAAPYILGELGVLKGKAATCYPGFEKHLRDAECKTDGVVTDGRIVTAKGMGVSLEFSLALVELLFGKDKRNTVAAQIMMA